MNFESECGDCGVSAFLRNKGKQSGAIRSRPAPLLNVLDHGHRCRGHPINAHLDKGKAAVIWSETAVTAPDGTPLWTQKRSIFARGDGGFGGERGQSTASETPERDPGDTAAGAAVSDVWGPRSAASDSEFAAAAGFPRPILMRFALPY